MTTEPGNQSDGFPLLILPSAPHCGIAGNAHDLKKRILERTGRADVAVVDAVDESTRAAVREATHIVGHDLSEELLEEAAHLRWFQATGSGVDHLNLKAMAARGIAVTSARGANSEGVAEHNIAAMLYFERSLGKAHRQMRRHEWRQFPAGVLSSKTLVVIGLGAIGRRVAELGKALSMNVVGLVRDPKRYAGAADEVYGMAHLRAVLSRGDYIVVAVPARSSTHHMISSGELDCMKTSAIVLNMTRGETLDTEALVLALQRGEIGGAALDVVEGEPLDPASPLWDFENVLITPHVAGSTPEYFSRLADIIVDNIGRIISGGYTNLRNEVT